MGPFSKNAYKWLPMRSSLSKDTLLLHHQWRASNAKFRSTWSVSDLSQTPLPSLLRIICKQPTQIPKLMSHTARKASLAPSIAIAFTCSSSRLLLLLIASPVYAHATFASDNELSNVHTNAHSRPPASARCSVHACASIAMPHPTFPGLDLKKISCAASVASQHASRLERAVRLATWPLVLPKQDSEPAPHQGALRLRR